MASRSILTVSLALCGTSHGTFEIADIQTLIFDDECNAAPCALELLQTSQLKNKRPNLVPRTTSLDYKANDLDHKADDLDHKADDLDHKADDLDHKADDLDHKADDLDHKADDLDHKADDLDYNADDLDYSVDQMRALIPRIMHQPELSALVHARQYPEVDEGIWSFDVPREVKMTSWTGQPPLGQNLLSRVAPNCHWTELPHGDEDLTILGGKKVISEWAYVIHDNQTDISEYDVVLFYLPFMMRTDWRISLPATKKEGQLWIATCGEPMFRKEAFMDCRLANDADFMQRMDGLSSYNPHSRFPMFFDTPSEEQMRLPPPNFAERGNELVTMSSSDCISTVRSSFIQAFMDEFAAQNKSSAILSYGQCFHTAEEVDKGSCGEPHELTCWANRCASRPFKLVAENSLDPWYVSEKVWDALYEGAIPIYQGPTQAKKLMPPGSVIFAEDYESPAALARAVLAYTEEDIKQAQAWKAAPVRQWNRWSEARSNSFVTLLPRICEAVAQA